MIEKLGALLQLPKTSMIVMFEPFLALLQGQDNPAGGVLCLGVVVILIVALVASSNKKQRELDAARAAYQASLSALKSNPTNADLRERTLRVGRA